MNDNSILEITNSGGTIAIPKKHISPSVRSLVAEYHAGKMGELRFWKLFLQELQSQRQRA